MIKGVIAESNSTSPMGRILLTGGAGYVGSHVNKYLSLKGYQTVVLDNLQRGHRDLARWGTFIHGDIGDSSILDKLFDEYRFDAVLHFAGYAYVGESVSKPMKYWKNNVLNTLTLLEKCSENKIEKFIFSSTCSTYGDTNRIPISESELQIPLNPYGAGKLANEYAIKDFAQAYGSKYFILRYFNAAGADPDCEIGERHIPETHLIPLLLDSVNDELVRMKVYGDDYPTDDGTCVRDYIHVMDLAIAHFLALKYLESGGASDACNLGLGTGFSVKEVIKSVERVTGKTVNVDIGRRRLGDPPVLIADPRRAKKILKWMPTYTEIDSIIDTAWRWNQKIHYEKS